MGRWLLLLVFSLSAAACEREPQGPAEVYQAFHFAIAAGDWDRAVQFLSPETRDAFRAVGEQLTAAVGHDEDPLVFFLRGVRAEVVRPLRAVKVVSQDDASAVVQVVAGQCAAENEDDQTEADQTEAGGPLDCSVSQVNLLKIEKRWLIRADLPRPFRRSAAAVRGG